MADFRVWGKIHQIGPSQFFVIATGTPAEPREKLIVLTGASTSLIDANAEQRRLMVEIGERVRDRGGQVVDAEAD